MNPQRGDAAPAAFTVVAADAVEDALRGREQDVLRLVEATYLTHDAGRTVNPASYFLSFPDRPRDRIIALPASVGGPQGVDGIKWIASVPDNVDRGLPRASAVLILNDPTTGFPFACVEASLISAARTAASAALAAVRLCRARGTTPRSLGVVGAGPIARTTCHYLRAAGIAPERVGVYDPRTDRAEDLADRLRRPGTEATSHPSVEDVVRRHELVVFATVAPSPHVHDTSLFDHAPVVLHVSLRDLSAEIVLRSWNVVDDVDHCLKANTSPHLAEQLVGHRDFVGGTLADVIEDRVAVPSDRTVVFSPFGLGVLDLALGSWVVDHARSTGAAQDVPGFLPTSASPAGERP